MATKKEAGASASPKANDYRKAEIAGIIDEVNSIVKISTISLTAEDRLNSGLLCLDLVYGGGLAPGMHVTFGPEQSAKTTAAITVMGASVAQDVDMRVLWDAENSTGSSTDYVTNIFQTNGVKATVEDIFQGDEAKGEVPLVFYRDDYEGEKFFNWLHAVEKRLPDKRFDEGRWWYVYDEKNKKAAERVKPYADKRMTSKNEGIWVPAEDGRAQLIILLDSFPSLVSASMDDDEGDNSIAVQARMFSKQIPRIKGALRAKRIVFLGINQLRLNPMARFGNPETEPGGQALKFFSDTRLRNFPRALSGVPYNPKGDGQIEKEGSILGEGEDTYRYIHVRAHKNKLAIPGRETWLRLWVSDANGDARGYDPVWDCVTGDTLVTTDKGLVRIDSLADMTKSADVDNNVWAVSGIKAIGHDGKYHKILNLQKKGKKKVFTVITSSGHRVKATNNHKFYVATASGDLVWKELRELNVGDHLVIDSTPRTTHPKKTAYKVSKELVSNYAQAGKALDPRYSKALDSDLAWLIGYVVSDGNLSKSGFDMYTSDVQILGLLCACVGRLFGVTPFVRPYVSSISGRPAYEVRVNSKLAYDVMKEFGLTHAKSRFKSTPSSILTAGTDVQAAYLRGLFSGDGSYSKTYCVYSSFSPILKQEVSLLMWQLGIPNRNTIVMNDNATLFYSVVGKDTQKKEMTFNKGKEVSNAWSRGPGETTPVYSSKLKHCLSKPKLRDGLYKEAETGLVEAAKSLIDTLDSRGFVTSPITDIVEAGFEQTFDISVADAHSFCANGVVVHNCFYYLEQTGQLSGKRHQIKLNIAKLGEATKTVTWLEFKRMVLDPKASVDIFKKIGLKPVNIRAGCLNQIRKGVAEKLYIETHRARLKNKKDDTDD